MSGKQTMTWNGDADTKLLIGILKVNDVKPDFEAVARQLSTDEVACSTRAVQEHLKKLRKIAQAEADPTAPGKPTTTPPAKASRKAAGAAPTGVKKTRKPATGGKGKRGKTPLNVEDAEVVAVKMETGSNDENDSPTKKRKYNDAINGSSDVGEGSVISSELVQLAQAALEDEIAA